MTRADFYIIPAKESAEGFICKLAGKIREQALSIHVHTESRQSAQSVDELLWTFKDISFLPHAMADTQDAGDTPPIRIGWQGHTPPPGDVLINLTGTIPDFSGIFARIIEVVPSRDPERSRARERYRQYRELGYELHSHDLESGNAAIQQ